MTEDDTFEALKKATFEDMQAVFQEIANNYRSKPEPLSNQDYTNWAAERNTVSRKMGWTVHEWQKENSRRIKHRAGITQV